jgi:hypothetical protein
LCCGVDMRREGFCFCMYPSFILSVYKVRQIQIGVSGSGHSILERDDINGGRFIFNDRMSSLSVGADHNNLFTPSNCQLPDNSVR